MAETDRQCRTNQMKRILILLFIVFGFQIQTYSQYGYTVTLFNIETIGGESFKAYFESECSGLKDDSLIYDCNSNCLDQMGGNTGKRNNMLIFYRRFFYYEPNFVDSISSEVFEKESFYHFYQLDSIDTDSVHKTTYLSYYFMLPFSAILSSIEDNDTVWMKDDIVDYYQLPFLEDTIQFLFYERNRDTDSLKNYLDLVTYKIESNLNKQMDNGKCCDTEELWGMVMEIVENCENMKVVVVGRFWG